MFVVFDLDGTLSNTSHRSHFLTEHKPKKWREFYLACSDDTLQRHTRSVLIALHRSGHHIEIWSGRSDLVRQMTEEWLRFYDIWYAIGVLRMRREGDYRSDVTLKREWLKLCTTEGAIKSPDLVFEDRDRVVEMWRQHGIPCFQVQSGDF